MDRLVTRYQQAVAETQAHPATAKSKLTVVQFMEERVTLALRGEIHPEALTATEREMFDEYQVPFS